MLGVDRDALCACLTCVALKSAVPKLTIGVANAAAPLNYQLRADMGAAVALAHNQARSQLQAMVIAVSDATGALGVFMYAHCIQQTVKL